MAPLGGDDDDDDDAPLESRSMWITRLRKHQKYYFMKSFWDQRTLCKAKYIVRDSKHRYSIYFQCELTAYCKLYPFRHEGRFLVGQCPGARGALHPLKLSLRRTPPLAKETTLNLHEGLVCGQLSCSSWSGPCQYVHFYRNVKAATTVTVLKGGSTIYKIVAWNGERGLIACTEASVLAAGHILEGDMRGSFTKPLNRVDVTVSNIDVFIKHH